MNKLIFLLPLLLISSCSQDKKNSITLGVDQTIKIPVNYVSVSANIELHNSDASTVEENGYEKLSQAVSLLEELGYEKNQLEVNSGEIRNRSYREEQSYQYNSSIKFDIKELDQIDSIRHALLKQGINSFDITAYKNTKEDSLYDHAYQQAIQNAKEKAQGLLTNQQLEIGKILNLNESVEETFEIVATKQSKQAPRINLDADLKMEPVDPLFNKKYYDTRIEFTIEFALN